MTVVRIAALDPSLTHFGVARLLLRLETLEFAVESLTTIVTEKDKSKQVRRNSDDLKRCKQIIGVYHELVRPCRIVFAEIPVGAQSARAAFAFGAATALVASSPVPVIQVQPEETKLATVGTKTASKEEIIEWAGEHYPKAPWQRYPADLTRKGKVIRRKGAICDSEEHVADAVAVAHAGIKTDQFQQLLALWRTVPANAA
jgi:Holliday junction resolvasome RuvABC endonuclease subunit